MSTLRTLRKLVLGETWTLPLGIGLAIAITAVVRVLAGAHGWYRDAGGGLLAVLLVLALAASLRRAR